MDLLSDIVDQTADSFGLGHKAGPLVAETAKMLFEERLGGLQGFIGHLEAAGLKEDLLLWQNPKKPLKPLDPQVLETLLGSASIQAMGKKLGLANARVRTAMAFVVPLLIRYFSQGASLPSTLPSQMTLFFDRDFSAAIVPRSLPLRPRRRAPKKRLSATLGWTLGVLVLLLSGLFLGLDILKNPSQGVSPSLKDTVSEEVAPPPSPVVDMTKPQSKLFLRNEAGQFFLSGAINSLEGKTAVIDPLQKFFGQPRIKGDLQIDPLLASPPWLTMMDRILPQLDIRGLDVRIDGSTVRVGGWINEADRESVLRSLKAAMGPGYRYGYLRSEEVELSQDAKRLVLNQLASLQPGYKLEDLIAILNRWIVRFEEGSSVFPEDSREVVLQAGEILKNMDPPFVLEIAVQTQKQTSQSQSLKLAHERANAVRDAFLQAGVPGHRLKTRGLVSEKQPGTEDQPFVTFWNQRIEFKVLQVCDALFPCELTAPAPVPLREKAEAVELPADIDPNRPDVPAVRLPTTIRTLDGQVIAPRASEPVGRSRSYQNESVSPLKGSDSEGDQKPKMKSATPATPADESRSRALDPLPSPRPKVKFKAPPPPPPKEPEWYDPFGIF